MYHKPVMLKECIDALSIKPNGVYVDATYGGGGHSKEILAQLGEKGKLFGFDQDADAVKNKLDDERLILINQNFRYLKKYLRLNQTVAVDGILFDLGVSSYQLDTPQKGFSTRFSGPLDMRMDHRLEKDAAQIINSYDATQLQRVFSQYGEVRNAKTLSERIVYERNVREITTTDEFKQILEPIAGANKPKYYAQVFQALRMEVNKEIEALEEALKQSLEILNIGGRLVVLTYHSLEDRPVKNFIKTGNFEGIENKDDFGVITRPFKKVTKKPIMASAEEVKHNPRSRSAKLRIAEKI